MEGQVKYEVEDHRDANLEMVMTYVPEAVWIPFSNALRLAHQRDAEAAKTLQLDCIQIASI